MKGESILIYLLQWPFDFVFLTPPPNLPPTFSDSPIRHPPPSSSTIGPDDAFEQKLSIVWFPYFNSERSDSIAVFCASNKSYERSCPGAIWNNFCTVWSGPIIYKENVSHYFKISLPLFFFYLQMQILLDSVPSQDPLKDIIFLLSKTAQFPTLCKKIVSISITEAFFICFLLVGLSFAIKMK